MNKQRPSNLAVLTMVGFTASCVGLLIFLWISFGGTLPFNAQGYRFSVEFNQATELASNAEVEIAGVTVGHVTSVGLDHSNGLTRAVIQIDHQYVPRPAGTRAILRQKSLLGETYVQLSAGNPHGPKLRDGATLPPGQVAPTVQLDQILNTFDPRTRAAFATWMQQGGIALSNRGQQFNAAFAAAVSVRHQRQLGTGGAATPAVRYLDIAARWRPGVLGVVELSGRVAGVRPQHQPAVCHDRQP